MASQDVPGLVGPPAEAPRDESPGDAPPRGARPSGIGHRDRAIDDHDAAPDAGVPPEHRLAPAPPRPAVPPGPWPPGSPEAPGGPAGVDVHAALAAERDHVAALRTADEQAARGNPLGQPVGLALSGGGIRSATLCLGAVQALAESRLLRRFDYLSTVSGGGYIGCWFSALLNERRRAAAPGDDPIGDIERLLSPGDIRERDEEPAEIAFLRAYSNYLTPRLGLFSADTLAALTGYLRNLFLSLLLAVLSTSLVLGVLHLLVLLVALTRVHPWLGEGMRVGATALLGIGALVASLLLTLQSLDARDREAHAVRRPLLLAALQFMQAGFVALMLPIVAIALLLAGTFLEARLPFHVPALQVARTAAGTLVMFALGAWLASELHDVVQKVEKAGAVTRDTLATQAAVLIVRWQARAARLLLRNGREVLRYVVAAAACALVTYQLLRLCGTLAPAGPVVALFRGPALATGIAAVAGMVWLGTVGTTYAELTREWLSRLLGTLVGIAGAWLLVGAVVVLARPVAAGMLHGRPAIALPAA